MCHDVMPSSTLQNAPFTVGTHLKIMVSSNHKVLLLILGLVPYDCDNPTAKSVTSCLVSLTEVNELVYLSAQVRIDQVCESIWLLGPYRNARFEEAASAPLPKQQHFCEYRRACELSEFDSEKCLKFPGQAGD